MFTAKRVGNPRDYIKGESGDWEVIIGLEACSTHNPKSGGHN
jgi:hypothetical protein